MKWSRLGENLGGVVAGLDLARTDDALYGAVWADDECGAHSAHVLAAVHRLLPPYAEHFYKFVVSVGNERERQRVLFDELAVRCLGIDADADHLIAGVEQCPVVVAQVAGLGRAARGHVFGIEIKGYGAAGEVAAAHGVAVLVSAEKVRNSHKNEKFIIENHAADGRACGVWCGMIGDVVTSRGFRGAWAAGSRRSDGSRGR